MRMRRYLAIPAVVLLTRVDWVVTIVVAVGLARNIDLAGLSPWLSLGLGLAGGMAAGDLIAHTPGTRRPVIDVCCEVADRVADWGGLAWEEEGAER